MECAGTLKGGREEKGIKGQREEPDGVSCGQPPPPPKDPSLGLGLGQPLQSDSSACRYRMTEKQT